MRACQCAFCRRHGAINTSDASGETVISAEPEDVTRYGFGLHTADFILCRHCGVYVAAVCGQGEAMRSTINVAGLRMQAFLDLPLSPMQYGAETVEERMKRRLAVWTPTRFVDAGAR